MRRWTTALCLLVALAAGGISAQGKGIQYRFHTLTAALEGRLHPVTRRNAAAVIRYGTWGQATGVLVAGVPGQDATGLVLTNEHVYRQGPKAEMLFPGGELARLIRVVAAKRSLDYALLEVELPATSTSRPVALRSRDARRGEEVYSVSASANPFSGRRKLERWLSVHSGNRASVEKARREKAMRTIQRGHAFHRHPHRRMTPEGRRQSVESTIFALPNTIGASGSPVFSVADHQMIALHWGGSGRPGRWLSSGTPMRLILKDLAWQLRRGKIPPALAARVQSLVDGANAR